MIQRLIHILLFVALVVPICILSAQEELLARQSSASTREPLRLIQPRFSETSPRFPSLVPHRVLKRPKVALVLSGGGARGVAAIGVLNTLQQADVPIDLIVGTSMGSIIGGLYASGYSTDQLKQMVDTTNWDDILSLNDEARRQDLFLDQKIANDRSLLTIRFKGFEPIIPASISTGQRLTNYLNILALQGIYHPNPSFDDLRIPFRAIASDLNSGRRVILDRGDLAEAMRASVTVPLLFSAVLKDSMRLVDGGLVSNIPVDVARDWGADIVVVLDVTSPLRPPEKLNVPWEIADQIMGIMMQSENRAQLELADIVIRPDLLRHLSNEFTDLDTLIDRGGEATRGILKDLVQLINLRTKEIVPPRAEQVKYQNARFEFDESAIGDAWASKLRSVERQPIVTEDDATALLTEMYQTGNFSRAEFLVDESADQPRLRLRAERNPVLQRVMIEGNNYVELDTLLEVFRPLIGHRVNFRASQMALENLLAVYRDRGYSLARILDVRFDSTSGIATLRLDEGIVYRRDIRGTEKTKDYVIWRELPWKEQDVFDVATVAAGITNLYSTNLFEQVSVSVRQEGERNEHQILVINVRERSTDLIRLGLRIDNERNLQPSVDLRDENFLGIGSELGVHFSGGLRNRSLIGEFKASRIFNSYFTFGLQGYYTFRDVNVFGDEQLHDPAHWNRVRIGEFRALRKGGTVTFGTQLERLGAFTVEGRLETHRVWSISNQPVPTESYRIAAIKFGTQLDNQDRFPYPRAGVIMNFFYESALVKLAESVGFTKLYIGYEAYQTYFRRHTIHPKIMLGFADETLPITEQFSIGGLENFLGLREDNALGRQLFIASLEYRYELPVKIFFDTYFRARYDLGSLWSAPQQIRLQDLRHGLGLGISFDTPIGPADFAVGKSFYFRKEILNKPLSLGPTVFYFTIGYHL